MEWLIIIIWIACAFAGMGMAEKRGRSKAGGFFVGLFLGLIGLAIIALMGDRRE